MQNLQDYINSCIPFCCIIVNQRDCKFLASNEYLNDKVRFPFPSKLIALSFLLYYQIRKVNRKMGTLHSLVIAMMLMSVVCDAVSPIDANFGALQKSWTAMMKRMRQKRALRPSNLISIRRLKKRIVAGETLLLTAHGLDVL